MNKKAKATPLCSTASSTFRLYLQAELGRRCAGNAQYSLRAFAKFLAIDHATLSQLLRGKRRCTPDGLVIHGTIAQPLR
ncbi:MAG TPA: hypothetical protein VK395_17495 [Gemmataceae bacterium]|nr:hypothetical protein [Gemmataceae bacterium]